VEFFAKTRGPKPLRGVPIKNKRLITGSLPASHQGGNRKRTPGQKANGLKPGIERAKNANKESSIEDTLVINKPGSTEKKRKEM